MKNLDVHIETALCAVKKIVEKLNVLPQSEINDEVEFVERFDSSCFITPRVGLTHVAPNVFAND